jgi:hypothetical protein
MVQRTDADPGDDLDDEDRQALHDSLEDAAESLARGEAIPAEEVLRLLAAEE